MEKKVKNYELDDKVDNFIKWYKKEVIKGNHLKDSEFQEEKRLRNFIEKMAVWYELRYPEYEVNRIMPGSDQEMKDINEEMFDKNSSINELIKQFNNKSDIKWSDFYNYNRFFNSLPAEEVSYLDKYYYPSILYINNGRMEHFHLDENGRITISELNYFVLNHDLMTLNLEEALEYLKMRKIELPKNNGIELEIEKAKKHNYIRKSILNCVMYRIIERGGNRIGPRRGLMFAKEFNTDINIPMIYGVDFSDPGLHLLIDEYLKLGGNINLECLVNYGSRDKKNQLLNTVAISRILEKFYNQFSTEVKENKRITIQDCQKFGFAISLLVSENKKTKQLKFTNKYIR